MKRLSFSVALVLLCAAGSLEAVGADLDLDAFCKEEEALVAAKAQAPSLTGEGCVSSVKAAIHRLWFEVAETLILDCENSEPKRPVSSAVYTAKSEVMKRVNKMMGLVKGAGEVRSIAPAFKWAQSREQILMVIKLAHKLDTPSTLGCKILHSTTTNTTLSFQADCAAKSKSFPLTLELLKPVVPGKNRCKMIANGRVSCAIDKVVPVAWARLLKKRNDPPQNMHTWWEMEEKHKDTLHVKLKQKCSSIPEDEVEAFCKDNGDAGLIKKAATTDCKATVEGQCKKEDDAATCCRMIRAKCSSIPEEEVEAFCKDNGDAGLHKKAAKRKCKTNKCEKSVDAAKCCRMIKARCSSIPEEEVEAFCKDNGASGLVPTAAKRKCATNKCDKSVDAKKCCQKAPEKPPEAAANETASEEPDADGDGIPDRADIDADGDGMTDEGKADKDNDGIADVADVDADGDGKTDEGKTDADGDGLADVAAPKAEL